MPAKNSGIPCSLRQTRPRRHTGEAAELLADYADEHAPDHYSRELEDHFIVTRIQPGKLWLEPLTSIGGEIGPVPVPAEVSRRCQEGWDLSGVVVKTSGGWRWLEVWNVTP